MREAVQKSARLLASCGFEVDSYRPAGLEDACDTWWFFFGELPSPFTRELLAGRESDAHWTGTELLNMTDPRAVISGRTVVEKLELRDHMRAVLLRQMERFPLLLLPVCSVAAFPHRQRNWQIDGRNLGLTRYHGASYAVESARLSWSCAAVGLLAGRTPCGRATYRKPYEEELLLHVGWHFGTGARPVSFASRGFNQLFTIRGSRNRPSPTPP